ncbi:hypothetical protein CDAR_125161 [Caerostris darwini]|uniref:Uncharacterized protein n=1 Tax=Caerostris darwini TaxID=1538125 RepID=A0AAV4SES7_9ARAC|nr:hypothetical protein CDAR_125161 [Caerostris darwini]
MGPRSALFKAGPRQKPQLARQVPRNLGQPSLIGPSTATRTAFIFSTCPERGRKKRCQTEPTSPKVRDLEMVKDLCVVRTSERIGSGQQIKKSLFQEYSTTRAHSSPTLNKGQAPLVQVVSGNLQGRPFWGGMIHPPQVPPFPPGSKREDADEVTWLGNGTEVPLHYLRVDGSLLFLYKNLY